MKLLLKFIGFLTFEEMIEHIDNEKYKFSTYKIVGHGYDTENKHYYEVEE